MLILTVKQEGSLMPPVGIYFNAVPQRTLENGEYGKIIINVSHKTSMANSTNH
jgi:hypothetical protein